MNSSEERLKILEMVADGTLSPEEAARLLEALESSSSSSQEEKDTTPAPGPRWLRIRVTDLDSNTQRVNIRIPWQLVKFGLKLGGRITIGGDNNKFISDEILHALEQAKSTGEIGKIVDVQDAEERERVEIFLE